MKWLGSEFVPTWFKIGRTKLATEQIEADKESLLKLKAMVLEWCIFNNFMLRGVGDSLLPNLDTSMGSRMRLYIYNLNFKSLCMQDNLNAFLDILRDTSFDQTTSRLHDLYINVVMELDARYVNLTINKLVHALNTVCPEGDDDDEDNPDLLWTEIFQHYPYFWLVFLIQSLMRTFTPSPGTIPL